MLKPPDFKQSRETHIIYELFRELPTRDDPLVTHRELCEATNRHLEEIRGAIATAKNRALNNDGLVIDNDRRIGYRLRKGDQITRAAERGSEKARKIVRTSKKKIDCVDRTKLTVEETARYFVVKTVLELQELPSRPRTKSNVTQTILRKHNELDQQEMLKAIKEALIKKR